MPRILSLIVLTLLANVAAVVIAADEAPQPSPVDDLKNLQGNWKTTFAIGGAKTLFGETPRIIQTLGDSRLQFRIEENRLSFACIRSIPSETITLCNDVPLPAQQEQVQNSVRGDRLLLLTLSNGKGLLASYSMNGDKFTLRYPAGCCSRSGNVIHFERDGK